MHETSVTFTTLKTNDSGSYLCSANISPQPRMSGQIVESSRSAQTINIAVGGCMASSTIQGIILHDWTSNGFLCMRVIIIVWCM